MAGPLPAQAGADFLGPGPGCGLGAGSQCARVKRAVGRAFMADRRAGLHCCSEQAPAKNESAHVNQAEMA
jgi:hypothetical protein